jgi:2'-5' RNA ligase
MSRLVIVLPLIPLTEGDSFTVSQWPLHVTVLPPFLTDASGAEVGDVVRRAASAHQALTVVAAQDEFFGRRHDIPVTVLADNEGLTTLHQSLRSAVRLLAAVPDEPAFTGAGFRPHVTAKPHGRVHAGDVFTLTQIAVVDMAPRSSPGRTVLATIQLPMPRG